MKKLSYLIVFLLFTGISCEKTDLLPRSGYEEVTLINMTGFDGCGYVFQKTDNGHFEPTNLGNFVTDPISGKEYLLKYKLASQQISICMMGPRIIIVELKEK